MAEPSVGSLPQWHTYLHLTDTPMTLLLQKKLNNPSTIISTSFMQGSPRLSSEHAPARRGRRSLLLAGKAEGAYTSMGVGQRARQSSVIPASYFSSDIRKNFLNNRHAQNIF